MSLSVPPVSPAPLPPFPSPCIICFQTSSLFCLECQIPLCHPCTLLRHSFGLLRTHPFHLLQPSLPSLTTHCVVCHQGVMEINCGDCEAGFCNQCFEEYHQVGNVLKLHGEIEKKPSLNRVTSNEDVKSGTLSDEQNYTKMEVLSDEEMEVTPTKHNRKSTLRQSLMFTGVPTLSFRLLNCGFSLLPSDLYCESENPMFLCIDRVKSVVSICEKNLGVKEGNGKLTPLCIRPLRFIKSVIQAQKEPKHFSIGFHLTKQTLECYAPSSEESSVLVNLLSDPSVSSSGDSDAAIYACKGFKKGSIQWSERWLVIKRKWMFVFRSWDSTVPVNAIPLQGSLGQPLPKSALQRAGKKVILIVTSDREFSFKLKSEAERDTFWKLLEEASFSVATSFDVGDENSVLDYSLNYTPVNRLSVNTPTPSKSVNVVIEDIIQPNTTYFLSNANDRRNQIKHLSRRLSAELSKIPSLSTVRKDNVIFEEDHMGDKVDHKMEFIEDDPKLRNIAYVAPPVTNGSSNSARHIIYWLIKILGLSMTEGAYITPALYVSKKIWHQSNAKFHAYGVKKENFILLHTLLAGLLTGANLSNTSAIRASVQEILPDLESIQNALCVHLAYVPEIKKRESGGWGASMLKIGHSIVKRATRAVSSNTKIDDSTDYINIIREICLQCQILDEWLFHFEKESSNDSLEILDHLNKVTDFLQNCSIVIRDMKTLLSRYSKHCSRSLISTV